jgi:hypothetical protein
MTIPVTVVWVKHFTRGVLKGIDYQDALSFGALVDAQSFIRIVKEKCEAGTLNYTIKMNGNVPMINLFRAFPDEARIKFGAFHAGLS